MSLLKIGQKVRLSESNATCEALQYLGGGGQGEVYRARLGDKEYALKWYFTPSATPEQWQGLDTLVKKGPPTEHFLWPIALALAEGVKDFGYVMDLRPPGYHGLTELMSHKISPSFRSLAAAGGQLANCFLQLHAMGLCYWAISWGNIFLELTHGGILICDIDDNVGEDGQPWVGVMGTPSFMAPEIERGEAMPSSKTDLHSLAVLLFLMFVIHHPLEGKRESVIHILDGAAMKKLYGTDPLFIFDPADSSNAPVPGIHDNALAFWPIYPKFFRDLFTKAFTEGLKRPDARVQESEWRVAMADLADCIVYCSNCGSENFFDRETPSRPCWRCKKEYRLPMRLAIGSRLVMLNHDTQLFAHHLDGNKMHDFSTPQATLQRHPTDPRKWGLKNLSSRKWVATLPDGSVKDVEPGRSIALRHDTAIQFGNVEGKLIH
jgi:DNA-binding helix-hairpin-helix protein with protein kinase domain